MKERPIIFGGEMVRAILAGEKTQTRRVIKPQPDEDGLAYDLTKCGRYDTSERRYNCPYGVKGDQLWVKETIRRIDDGDYSFYVADGHPTPADTWPWKRDKISSIYCGRGLSRINLLIKDIRVKRVRDTSESSARAEGVTPSICPPYDGRQYRAGFMTLWDSINKKRGYPWDSNPWVWVVEFEVTSARKKPKGE